MTLALRRLIKAVVAALVIALLSGVPQVASAFMGVDDGCSSECAGSFGTKHCPPNCSQGSCAKMLPAVVGAVQAVAGEHFVRVVVPIVRRAPRLASVVVGVFHPPRARPHMLRDTCVPCGTLLAV